MEMLTKASESPTQVVGIKSELNDFIKEFDDRLQASALPQELKTAYKSIDDLLIRKYHKANLDKTDFPDFRNKTEFVSDGVRGNVQKIGGNILSYGEANSIIEEALKEDIP